MTTSVTVYLAPAPINVTQFIPGGNTPANGAQLFAYAAGSSNKQNTYTTSSGSVAWSNPIILDSGGNLTGSKEVWLAAGQTYDFVLAPSTDQDPPLSPYWTVHSITGINDTTVTASEWIGLGSTATFVNASTFTVTGDATGTLTPQRRLKTVNTGGTFYSTVTSSVFSTSTTTIGITSDSTGIDSGLNAVSYGLIETKNDAVPFIFTPQRFGAKGDGFTNDTVSIQSTLNAYAAAIADYQSAAPSVQLESAPAIMWPRGIYICGNVSTNATSFRMYGENGSIIKFSTGSTGFTITNVSNLSIKGIQFVEGANAIIASNNNLDGALFEIVDVGFNKQTDWPVTFSPTNPSSTSAFNHLSGISVLDRVRWYDTNGCLKTFFDKTVVRDSYLTLYSVSTHATGVWATSRSAFENRSLGYGIELANVFCVPLGNGGNSGNVIVDNYPGLQGVSPVDNVNYIGSTSPVSEGGGVYIHDSRLGSEEGGVPAIRNWCHGLGGFSALGRVHLSIVNCGQIAGGTGANNGLIQLKQGCPNSIVIKGGTGPSGTPLISTTGIVDLSGAGTTLSYWLNASRNGSGRISVDIEGRNRNLGGSLIIPTDLIQYARYDSNESDPRTIALPLTKHSMGDVQQFVDLTFSSSINIDASLGNFQRIIATNTNTAFSINQPTNQASGQYLTIQVKNTSGGTLSTATWSGIFKMKAWVNPANTSSRSVTFIGNPATEWVEISRTEADIPN